MSVKEVFQWGGKQQKAFKTLKEKIRTTPFLEIPYLHQPFEIQTNARGYAMGTILMQHGKPICYHSKTFTQVLINYTTYDKELYVKV